MVLNMLETTLILIQVLDLQPADLRVGWSEAQASRTELEDLLYHRLMGCYNSNISNSICRKIFILQLLLVGEAQVAQRLATLTKAIRCMEAVVRTSLPVGERLQVGTVILEAKEVVLLLKVD